MLVARLLNLLCNYRLRCITLHSTIHEIQLLNVHRIFSQLGQIASINLNAGRRCSSALALMHQQLRVLAVRAALRLRAQVLLARLEALWRARRATFLSIGALQR